MKKFIYQSPVGNLCICETNEKISHISFFDQTNAEVSETPLIKEAHKQLCEYFDKKRKVFNLPLLLEGTEFQVKVWKALQTIEYGKTASYKEIANIVGSEKAFRAVGNANNKNKIAIVIPCHRVIGSNGSAIGYAGGIEKKMFLLNLEKTDNRP